MGIFDKMKEPVFFKESTSIKSQIEQLKELEPTLNSEGKKLLQQDIQFLEYGMIGEDNIAFELKNSHMAMYILRDIFLKDGDLTAQIDYLIITRKLTFIIECKNLYGNIEINSSGDFIRSMEFGGKKKQEGIYSPITQNQRHMELLKKLRVEAKNNFITKMVADKYFDTFHKSVVVLANPKTVLNAKYANKDVKNQVIRADQLVKYIKECNTASKEMEFSDSDMLQKAESILKFHMENENTYTKKYEKYNLVENESIQKSNESETIIENLELTELESTELESTEIEDTEIFKALKEYRLKKSREEKVKPYFLYNDLQLKDLVEKVPENYDQLLDVAGFGKVKVEKYGDEILEIINKYKI